jgi:hypothetical protein
MNYEYKWKVLADFLTVLKERGKQTPETILNDLRSARTIIKILKADPEREEIISRIDQYLRNVESYAIFTAEKMEKKMAEDWLKKLKDQKKRESSEKNTETSRFSSGIPKSKNWVRIKMAEDIPQESLQKCAKSNKLSYQTQKNGYIVVYGNQDNVKNFIKMMANQFRNTKK